MVNSGLDLSRTGTFSNFSAFFQVVAQVIQLANERMIMLD